MRTASIRATMLVASVVGWLVMSASPGTAQQPGQAAGGPVPTVQAVATASDGDVSFRPSNDPPARAPNHPPIDQVPPMPMPDNPDPALRAASSSGPGQGIIYDAVTRREALAPMSFEAAAAEFAIGGGYAGADGAAGSETLPATMGGMSLLSPATRATFPYRMNVKLLMRFGGSYFVCSGSMRNAATVLTAGHCIYDTDTNAWADEVWVYPAWDGVGSLFGPPSIVNPYGWAHSSQLGSWTGWTVNEDLNYDIGVVAMDRASGFLTGWFGWAYGGNCAFAQTTFYNSGSYPAESCGGGLHTGAGMYFWGGSFDTCPNTNRLGLFTPIHGCTGAVWGGMSGSGAYYIDAGNRYTHAVTSTSNRFDYAEYTRQWLDWINFLNGTFDPVYSQGASFDLQPLDMNGPASFVAGQSTGGLTHLGANGGNAAMNTNYTFRVYLSSNDNIDASDTLLSTQVYGWNYGPVSSVNVNMAGVTIPANTPPGNYYLGVIYDNSTDIRSINNDTDGWDALPISVLSADLVVNALAGPSVTNPGESFDVSNTVHNNGNAATGLFRLGLYLSPDNVCTGADTLIGSRMLSLGGSGSSAAFTPVTIPAGAAFGAQFICAIADDLNDVGEYNESNNTRSTPIDIKSAVPVLTLKINGQHPTPPVVSTTGLVNLTLSIAPTTYMASLDWYWAIVYNGSLFWVTSSGVSLTPAPLLSSPPVEATDVPLLNLTLPPGASFTTVMFMVNGGTVVASDFITAVVTASSTVRD